MCERSPVFANIAARRGSLRVVAMMGDASGLSGTVAMGANVGGVVAPAIAAGVTLAITG